jgi:biopolymer transport protein ExbB
VIDYIQKGGLLMWPILACSIVPIAIFAERFFYLHRATIQVGEFLKGLSNLIQRRNFAEALHESAGTPGPVARVIHAALLQHAAPRSELREIVQEAGQLEVPKLERFLGMLATLAFLAPLLGLIGTVSGMMEAFSTVAAHGGYATVTELSGGVYKSLLTTAAGLVVATPTFVAYSYLSARVNAMLHEMERAGIEIVHLLKDSEAVSGIISFQASSQDMTPGREVRVDR